MSEETVYIQKCSIKQFTFDNGDSCLNMSIHEVEMEQHKNEGGWLSITINKRREASPDGKTHYAKLNTYKPKEDTEQTESSVVRSKEDDDDLPF